MWKALRLTGGAPPFRVEILTGSNPARDAASQEARKGDYMAEEVESCRDEDGTTVGLVDAAIGAIRALASGKFDLSPGRVQEALADFSQDPDLQKVRDAYRPSDAEIIPATPEEYRAMLDSIGLYSRSTADGFKACMVTTRRSTALKFRRCDPDGWWEILDDDDTCLWMSAHASQETADFIRSYMRVV